MTMYAIPYDMIWYDMFYDWIHSLMFSIRQELGKHKGLENGSVGKEQEHHEVWRTFKEVLSSRILVVRGLILFFIWATDAFVFYGLSLNATSLSGNKFVNFILVCLGKWRQIESYAKNNRKKIRTLFQSLTQTTILQLRFLGTHWVGLQWTKLEDDGLWQALCLCAHSLALQADLLIQVCNTIHVQCYLIFVSIF